MIVIVSLSPGEVTTDVEIDAVGGVELAARFTEKTPVVAATPAWAMSMTDPATTVMVYVWSLLAEAIRVVAILTKPFLPKTSERFYSAFNFSAALPWERVSFADVIEQPGPFELEVTAPLQNGKPAPLFPRIGSKAAE